MDIDKTEKKRRTNFISKMRKAFVLSEAYVTVKQSVLSEEKGPKGGARYRCSECGELFPKTKIDVDHIEPFTPYDMYQYEMTEKQVIERMFCDISNLRAICKDFCHKRVTNEQRKLRSEAKKKRKQCQK